MIAIQSPTRVDLAGGTLDCWPLHLFVGDCVTVNIAIDVFTGCELSRREDPSIHLLIQDLNYEKSFDNLQTLIASEDPELLLVQKILEYYKPTYGMSLKTYSRSPVGGGLGGSSSLCISIIKAFNQANGFKMSTAELVELAHNLEAKIIKSPTGTQDYVPAIEAGLNVISYRSDGIKIENLPVPLTEFQNKAILVYTGRSHHSGINNWQVIKSVIEGDGRTISALKEIAVISDEMAAACRKQEWRLLPDLFKREFASRIRLSEGFSSPEINKLSKIVVESGAEAVKICGAGGGGCILVWADRALHEGIKESCRKNGFQPIEIKPVERV